MSGAKDKKNLKISPEYNNLGDASFLLDEDLQVSAILRVDDSYLSEALELKTGNSILKHWNILAEKEEVIAELKKNAKWETFFNFNNKWILMEIVPAKSGARNLYYSYLKVARITVPQNSDSNGACPVVFNLPGIFYKSSSLQKDSQFNFCGGLYNLTGYTEEELSGLPGRYLSLVYYEDIPLLMKVTTDLGLDYGKKSEELVYRIIRKDGEIVWVKENITSIKDPSTRRQIYQGMIVEINKLKAYEQKLLESEARLMEINQSKDRFINILSHDLRAPFTSILGFSEILLNETNLSGKEKTEYLTYIYEASQNQLQFIGYLLDWSRLRTGSLKIEAQRLKIQALIYNCVSILTGNAIRKNISIHVDINDALYVQADERLLTQVVLNLLSNSIKFSYENSAIEISAVIFNDTHIEVVVKDYGMGISSDDQSKIFSIEKNYSKDGTKGEKGSGFGLALVKEIISKHGGEIWFYSEPEQGAEFHFTLPLPSNTILIVNDNEEERNEVIELIKLVFPEFGIIAVENGYEAIGVAQQQAPNLLIANHSMPLMTGHQLMEAIKRGETDLKIPSIIIGNHITRETESLYMRLGVKAVFSRPFDKEEFIRALRMILH